MPAILEHRQKQSASYVLITGGAGYVGSHIALVLIERGYRVVVVDNLFNSSKESLAAVTRLTQAPIPFYQVDLLDRSALRQVFAKHSITAAIHCAGHKAVGESVRHPQAYYENNVMGTLNLLHVMLEFGVLSIIYSSSATVYGDPEIIPIPEHCPIDPTSPYGRSKYFSEAIMMDYSRAYGLKAIILRYFNPAGAHPSGQLGEDPRGEPYNLMPFMAQVAQGKRARMAIYGDDYKTRDGTGLRDYIHIMDLARGHLAALQKLPQMTGHEVYNLGSGNGSTVLEMNAAFSRVVGSVIPYTVEPRRAGDVDILLADPKKARRELGWQAQSQVHDMCQDLWRWVSLYPEGYRSGQGEDRDKSESKDKNRDMLDAAMRAPI